MKKFTIAIGSDHAGFKVKSELIKFLAAKGHRVVDFGTHSDEFPSDYPDFAAEVGRAVSGGRCERGVLPCGSGNGMCISANKIRGVRAGVAWSVKTAKLCAEHNWCTVLCVPARMTTTMKAKKMVQAWLETPHDKGGRHERRVKKILKLESNF